MKNGMVMVLSLCLVNGVWALCVRADGCHIGCWDATHFKNTLSNPKCSAFKPRSRAFDSSIDWSPNGDVTRQRVLEDGVTVKHYKNCEACSIRCPDSTPSYGISDAAEFVFNDDECEDIIEVQRWVCRRRDQS